MAYRQNIGNQGGAGGLTPIPGDGGETDPTNPPNNNQPDNSNPTDPTGGEGGQGTFGFPSQEELMNMITSFSGLPQFQQGTGNTGQSALQQVFERGMNLGNGQEYDRAANRLRDRLSLESQGFQQQAVNQRLGSGFQGALQQQLGNIRGQQLAGYQQGLVGLEEQQRQAALEGLTQAQNAATGLSEFDLGVGEIGQQNTQSLLNFLSDILRTQFGFGGDILNELVK